MRMRGAYCIESLISDDVLADIIRRALSKSGDYADVYVEYTKPLSIQLEDNRIEKCLSGVDAGIGIRVISGGRCAYAFSNNFSPESLMEIAGSVSSAFHTGQGDITMNFSRLTPSIDFNIRYDPRDVDIKNKIMLVESANSAARKVSSRIKQVSVVYRDVIQNTRVATSEGTFSDDERVYTMGMIQVVASDGEILQTGYEPVGGFCGFELFEEEPFQDLAVKASRRAVMLLDARKAIGGRMPVIISAEAGGTMIHEAIGHGLEADLVQQGLSVYAGRKGEQIASSAVSIIDDATLTGRRGSFRFDDEGVPAQRTMLVENGILKQYLYDRLSAMKDNAFSTGNGRRQSYRHRPIPRMSNTFIAPGNGQPDEIIRSVENGFFVRKVGGGQVNTVTGEFVFEVLDGSIIEKGQIGDPVRGATLIGNGREVLQSIDMVGNDLGFSIGTCGKDAQGVPVSDAIPTLRIPEMVVGGDV